MTPSNQKSIRVRAATRARLRCESGPAGEAVEGPLTTGTLGRPSPPAVRTVCGFRVSRGDVSAGLTLAYGPVHEQAEGWPRLTRWQSNSSATPYCTNMLH